jgi:hypothetical protein
MDLLATLSAHRAHLLQAFRGPAWGAVAASYGATAATRPDQLRQALTAVEQWARQVGPTPEVAAHLDTFVSEAMDEAVPKQGAVAGLAMIFANATANAGWWAQQRAGAGSTYVARCHGCGATQQKVLIFDCQYCGAPLYGDNP